MTYRLHDVFTAIADPNRRQILNYLSENEMPVNEIAGRFHISRTAVSKHLKVLQRTNLVYTRQAGRQRIYGLNARPLLEVRNWLQQYEKFWGKRLLNLKNQVEKSG
ncbi:winged helix-turn-helix transcriptional regulator [candidate division KSB1 bacterium]|nr:winged helix-turn-helix transcriptional regulator [candidate division KSB1 bacterium]NIR70078.1 winged helix-turn-helix transcriptional regulator [candidate division KSB1 bacterium]NIS24428.1 winged helix-turn-helix transcriptional regulator [candidate division KSB1 bacterium]NIT71364.1 winged helix-turn-helix transcriptional regulator [candidate division KSB1 bacterium]NIU25043.1 winged helix-turn-helix transcriptional regulator [candidate division KSB1 bacterium]